MTDQDMHLILTQPTRLVVIGNSGSGKSTLANKIATSRHVESLDLDDAFWLQDHRQRNRDEAASIVTAFCQKPAWVIEGVFEFLLEVALRRATGLVWLGLSWDDCRKGLLQRGSHHGMNPNDPIDLKAWQDAHEERLTNQAKLYDEFLGHKVCLRTRDDMASFVAESSAARPDKQ